MRAEILFGPSPRAAERVGSKVLAIALLHTIPTLYPTFLTPAAAPLSSADGRRLTDHRTDRCRLKMARRTLCWPNDHEGSLRDVPCYTQLSPPSPLPCTPPRPLLTSLSPPPTAGA